MCDMCNIWSDGDGAMEKSQAGKGDWECQKRGEAILNKAKIRKGLPRNEACCYVRKSIQGRENKCKGPEVGLC